MPGKKMDTEMHLFSHFWHKTRRKQRYVLSGICFLIIRIGKGKQLNPFNGDEGRVMQELNEV